MPYKINILLYVLGLIGVLSCSSPSSSVEEEQKTAASPPSYAQGFTIAQGDGYKIVEVLQAYPGAHDPYRYLVIEEKGKEPDHAAFDAVITLPVSEIVLTSTTQVPHLDFLEMSETMVGFPDTDLISSTTMRQRIDQGLVVDLGKGPVANIEMVVDLDPDLVMYSSLRENLEQLEILEKAGIPLILNGEYTEQNPLGRAEWIKFTGALTGRYEKAVEVFEEIEESYLSLKASISSRPEEEQPTVISGMMYKDIWYAPAAENWGALFFADAGANYVFKEEEGTGSLQLNYEYVLDKAMDAEVWIGAADFKDLAAMKEADHRYANFNAFRRGEVYTYTNKRGATGGYEYFELGYMRPDIILKDLIKIFYPEQLPDYQPYFYEKLN